MPIAQIEFDNDNSIKTTIPTSTAHKVDLQLFSEENSRSMKYSRETFKMGFSYI